MTSSQFLIINSQFLSIGPKLNFKIQLLKPNVIIKFCQLTRSHKHKEKFVAYFIHKIEIVEYMARSHKPKDKFVTYFIHKVNK